MKLKFKDYCLYIGLSNTARKWHFQWNGLKNYHKIKKCETRTGFSSSILRINLFNGKFLIALTREIPPTY